MFKTYWEQFQEALQYLKPGRPLNTFDSSVLGADLDRRITVIKNNFN